jgi:basic amino acid/polyamine antiporter, APA family
MHSRPCPSTRWGCAGAGIYVLTGQAAAIYAGPAVVVSFALSAVACGFAALCYSELAAIIPSSGSAYTCVSSVAPPPPSPK